MFITVYSFSLKTKGTIIRSIVEKVERKRKYIGKRLSARTCSGVNKALWLEAPA